MDFCDSITLVGIFPTLASFPIRPIRTSSFSFIRSLSDPQLLNHKVNTTILAKYMLQVSHSDTSKNYQHISEIRGVANLLYEHKEMFQLIGVESYCSCGQYIVNIIHFCWVLANLTEIIQH